MALKKKISVDDFNSLSEDMQTIYVQNGDGYILDLESETTTSVDEIGALKRALARERQDSKTVKEKLADLELRLQEGDTKDAIKAKDIEKLTAAHEAEKKRILEENKSKLNGRDEFIIKKIIDSEAKTLSTKLGGKKHASVFLPHIKSRLAVSFESDEPELQVLDGDGNPTYDLDKLEKELLDNKSFAPILVGSKASGSGASGINSGGGASTAKKFDDHTSAELKALRKSDPDAYDRLKAARKS